MEKKTNWIEKIREAVRVAMNKGLNIRKGSGDFPYIITIEDRIGIHIFKDGISISTLNGYIHINHSLTDREELEIKALILSIKEYKEDMAISEFEDFISGDKKEEITDINNLDDDE
jgi:repressor of nif and glnA expression